LDDSEINLKIRMGKGAAHKIEMQIKAAKISASKTIKKPKVLQKKTTQDDLVKMPAILCDIDGVVIRGTTLIGNSVKTIRKVLSTQRDNKRVPFVFLTNGGMMTEK
jgi:ribonucleotide monophosphatase NagD (HAD superfamily)